MVFVRKCILCVVHIRSVHRKKGQNFPTQKKKKIFCVSEKFLHDFKVFRNFLHKNNDFFLFILSNMNKCQFILHEFIFLNVFFYAKMQQNHEVPM